MQHSEINVITKFEYNIAEHRLLVDGLQKGDHVIKRCVLVWTSIIRIIKNAEGKQPSDKHKGGCDHGTF